MKISNVRHGIIYYKGEMIVSNYFYADRNDKEDVEEVKEIIDIILSNVYQSVWEHLSFDYNFAGSCKYNMITYNADENSNLEFDVDIILGTDGDYNSNDVYSYLLNAINSYSRNFNYSVYENDDNIEIRRNGFYTCCFYIVYDCSGKYKGLQQYVSYGYNAEKYLFANRDTIYNNLDKWVRWLKENQVWNKFKVDYLHLKNTKDNNKSSKELFLWSIKAFYFKNNRSVISGTEKQRKAVHDFQYVEPEKSKPIRAKIDKLISMVHEEVRSEYSFQHQYKRRLYDAVYGLYTKNT